MRLIIKVAGVGVLSLGVYMLYSLLQTELYLYPILAGLAVPLGILLILAGIFALLF